MSDLEVLREKVTLLEARLNLLETKHEQLYRAVLDPTGMEYLKGIEEFRRGAEDPNCQGE